ncbi:MAG: YgfZ/GcvT domain-containing protein [Parvibaculales bacterium]
MSNHAATLSDRVLLSVSGPDKESFLDGLVSNSLTPLSTGKAVFTCLLTPQGKVLHDFLIYPFEDDFLLDVAAADAPVLAKKLGFYKLRADVEISTTDMTVSAVWGDVADLPSTPFMFRDPRLDALGLRVIGPLPEILTPRLVEADMYTHHRILNGVPQGPAEIDSSSAFPLEYRLDKLNGIDFHKGCFIGQEVTSRAYRKGSLRKALFVVAFDGAVAAGDPVLDGERTVGEVRAVSGTQGLALLRLDRLDAKLTTQQAEVTLKD